MIRSRWVAACLAVALAGCSAVRVAYDQAPEIAWWWLGGYLSFNDQQRPAVRQALVQVHGWHRRTQLPAYAELLARWEPVVRGELSASQVCQLADEATERAQELSGLAEAVDAPALSALSTLSRAQIAELEKRLAKKNREFRDKYLEVTPPELLAERVKQGVSGAERLYGRLQPEQKRALEAALARSPWDVQATYARRLKRQQALVQSLQSWQGATPEQVRVGLRVLIDRSLELPDASDRAAIAEFRRGACQVLAELHNSTTPAQRSRAVETLRRYGSDFKLLAQSL